MFTYRFCYLFHILFIAIMIFQSQNRSKHIKTVEECNIDLEHNRYLLFSFPSLFPGGRVVSLAMVGNVFKVSWMAGGSAFILITNYTMSLKMYVDGNKIMSWPRKLFYPIPIAFLYALSMTRKRGLMMVNTFFWLLLSLPQIAMYNKKLAQWGLFLGPFLAQFLALVLLLWKWEVVEVAFRRFERLLKKV